MTDFLSNKEIEDLIYNPINKIIDFDKINKITFPRLDIIDSEITGTALIDRHEFGKGNLINCGIRNFKSLAINFDYVDFKDCNFRNSRFERGSFDNGAMINNVFSDCVFEDCHFANMSITESQFNNTNFYNCDLSNMVIKGCRFSNCNFSECKTSNKLIEDSLLFNCVFQATNIQLETITDNFGISEKSLVNSQIRDNRTRDEYSILHSSQLRELLNNDGLSVFTRLKIVYFFDSEIFISGHDLVDQLFNIGNWVDLFKLPSTFVNQLELLLEFLMYEYEQNNLLLVILLKFHRMTSVLVDQVNLPRELYKSVMGVHMTLSRITEVFLQLLFETAKGLAKPNLALKVLGPLQLEYYKNEFAPFIDDQDIQIVDVRKCNSPNMLIFEWQNIGAALIPIGILLATRLKVEVSKYYLAYNVSATHISDKKNVLGIGNLQLSSEATPKLEELKIFNMDIGLSEMDQKALYSIKFRSIIPGNLIADIKLDVSTKILGKMKKLIVDIIK